MIFTMEIYGGLKPLSLKLNIYKFQIHVFLIRYQKIVLHILIVITLYNPILSIYRITLGLRLLIFEIIIIRVTLIHIKF